MTVAAGEDSQAIEDRFFTADDPDDEGVPGVAADGPPPDDPDRAPYGWTRDTGTRQWRPKKSPGRPKSAPPPTAEEVAAAPPITGQEDAPPPARGRGRRRGPAPTDESVPMPKSGVIAKGVDRLYRRGGKILRIVDDEIGLAFIECTRRDPDDPDAPTVGEAWEALAKSNPRIRAFLVKAIAGGDWQALIMTHAAIAVALFTRDWVRRFIPVNFERAVEVVLEPDEDSGPDDLRPEDVADMRAHAEAEAQRIASRMGVKVPSNIAAAAMREAEARAARAEAPEAFQRKQPRANGSRAKRRGGR